MSLGLEAVKASGVNPAISSENTPSFMRKLQEATLDCINQDAKLSTIEGLDVEKVRGFITTLSQNGYAELRGTDQECRSVCVTAQGALEDALGRMLQSGEVKDVKAVFLTPLPTTPLRKEGLTEGLTAVPFDSARQYTLDMRENTLRALRESGGIIYAAYSKASYLNLKSQSDEGSLKQVSIWEKECKHVRVINVPLDIQIPADLVGALYLIIDREGSQFYLPTQGIQAKDAPEGEAIWKKWLTLSNSDNEGVEHSQGMLECIEIHGNEKITF